MIARASLRGLATSPEAIGPALPVDRVEISEADTGRRARRLVARARSLGGYFADGARLLHVRTLSRDGRAGLVVDDCQTLSLFYATVRDFEGMRLVPVTVAEARP